MKLAHNAALSVVLSRPALPLLRRCADERGKADDNGVMNSGDDNRGRPARLPMKQITSEAQTSTSAPLGNTNGPLRLHFEKKNSSNKFYRTLVIHR